MFFPSYSPSILLSSSTLTYVLRTRFLTHPRWFYVLVCLLGERASQRGISESGRTFSHLNDCVGLVLPVYVQYVRICTELYWSKYKHFQYIQYVGMQHQTDIGPAVPEMELGKPDQKKTIHTDHWLLAPKLTTYMHT